MRETVQPKRGEAALHAFTLHELDANLQPGGAAAPRGAKLLLELLLETHGVSEHEHDRRLAAHAREREDGARYLAHDVVLAREREEGDVCQASTLQPLAAVA